MRVEQVSRYVSRYIRKPKNKRTKNWNIRLR